MYDLSVYQLPSTLPSTNATDPATNATDPAANATNPATNATYPAANATDPATNVTDPATNATDPATEPQFHCVSVDKSTIAAADTCMGIDNKDGCYNLQGKCEWTAVTDTKPIVDDGKLGFCKWNEPAGTSAAANPCNIFTEDKDCNSVPNGECIWEPLNNKPTTPEPKQLFKADFCHPSELTGKDA
jgi:hypothetical protein